MTVRVFTRRRGPIAPLAILVLTSGLLAGCGGSSSGPSITLYNGQHEQTTDALVAGFERRPG